MIRGENRISKAAAGVGIATPQLLVSRTCPKPQVSHTPLCTLLSDLNLPAPKLCLFDVLHTEIAAALGVGLLFLSGGHLIIRAVCVRGS